MWLDLRRARPGQHFTGSRRPWFGRFYFPHLSLQTFSVCCHQLNMSKSPEDGIWFLHCCIISQCLDSENEGTLILKMWKPGSAPFLTKQDACKAEVSQVLGEGTAPPLAAWIMAGLWESLVFRGSQCLTLRPGLRPDVKSLYCVSFMSLSRSLKCHPSNMTEII